MSLNISKLCADHLRAFSNNHGVKMKSAHAHELVAAIFGYKSKAAMQADTLCSIENFSQAQMLVLTPSLFIEQRRECLQDLPANLPNVSTLAEEMFVCLISKGRFIGKTFAAWEHLAEILTTEYLQNHGYLLLPIKIGSYGNVRQIFNKPFYKFKPKVETTDSGIKLTVDNRYYYSIDGLFELIDVILTIDLQRIAGHVGYAKPEISVINVSSNSSMSTGEARLDARKMASPIIYD